MNENKGMDRSPLVTLGVALAMVAVFLAAVYVPDTRRLRETREELQTAKTQLADALSLARELPQVAARVDAMKADYEHCMLRVPTQPMVPQFLETVADLLQAEGLVQRELVPQQPRSKGAYSELPIAIAYEGPFASVYRVMARLERLDRTNHVENIKFSVAPGQEGVVRVEMGVVIYYRNVESPARTTAAAGKAGNT